MTSLFQTPRKAGIATLLASTLIAGAASATTIEVTVTNTQAQGGLFLTPLLSVFHDGSFNAFDAGASANAGVELLAEEGSPAGVIGDINAANTANGTSNLATVVANPDGFGGAPVLDPGEVTTIQIELDPSSNRYFSFLSMVIPSNDTFIGNDDAFAYELFDDANAFIFDGAINVFASDAWDAGTEADNGNGAAFAPPTADAATDTDAFIAGLPNLDFLVGRPQAPGGSVVSASGQLLSITFAEVAAVPVPASFPLLLAGFGVFGLMRRRARS